MEETAARKSRFPYRTCQEAKRRSRQLDTHYLHAMGQEANSFTPNLQMAEIYKVLLVNGGKQINLTICKISD